MMDLSNLEKSVSDKYWAFRPLFEDVAPMQSVLVQLNQALSSGRLRGEEFNTIAEHSPVLLYSIANLIGVTIGELRQMANRGMLTSNVVAKALRLIFEASASQFAANKNTKVYVAVTQNSCDGGHEIRGVFNTKAQAAGTMIVAVNGMVEWAESQGHDADDYFYDQYCSVLEVEFGNVLVEDKAIRNELATNSHQGVDAFLRELREIVAKDDK